MPERLNWEVGEMAESDPEDGDKEAIYEISLRIYVDIRQRVWQVWA